MTNLYASPCYVGMAPAKVSFSLFRRQRRRKDRSGTAAKIPHEIRGFERR
jgi:hypothetical protein